MRSWSLRVASGKLPNCPHSAPLRIRLSTGQSVCEEDTSQLASFTNLVQFTALENLALVTRCLQYVRRRMLTWLGYPVPSRYIRHQSRGQIPDNLGTGYLLIEYIEEAQGRMLSRTWNEKRHEPKLRTNLFRDLSRIFLTLFRVPLPLIGSFIIDDKGFLRLGNRPLSLEIHDFENEQIPVHIPRDFTYSTVDSYVVDILALHDSRLHHQPNAINDVEDGLFQMAALTIMKTISSRFFRRDLRRGPVVFSLTDLHQSWLCGWLKTVIA